MFKDLDIPAQTKRVQQVLQIPISRLDFKKNCVEIYSGTRPIGFLSVQYDKGLVKYNFNEARLLAWWRIFDLYRSAIMAAIRPLLSTELKGMQFRASTFAAVLVGGPLDFVQKEFSCFFDGKHWTAVEMTR